MAYFPLFIDITEKKCLVIGGGTVAFRKIKLLLEFGAHVEIISQDICSEIMSLVEADNKTFGNVTIEKAPYDEACLTGKTLVIVATNDSAFNKQVAKDCREKNIPVNVVDDIEECSFILPSIVRQRDVVAAFSSSGKSPVVTQYLKRKEEAILTEKLGEINDTLGRWRDRVKEMFSTESKRKEVYVNILERSLCEGRTLTDEEIQYLIDNEQEK